MKKIVIDTRMMFHGGIGTYLRHLIPHFSDHGYEIILLQKQMKSPIYSASEQIEMPLKIPHCDLFWSPHFNIPLFPIRAKKRLVTIHDLFHLDHLNELSLPKRLYAKYMIRKAVSLANSLITVSEFSKERLLSYFPEAKEKIFVIPSGADHLHDSSQEKVDGLPQSFFLVVSNLKPHKNLPILLDAMKQLPQMHLVIVGTLRTISLGSDLKNRVHFLGQVSDAELTWLYKNTQALIFPSLYEGWGLPPLEAMHLGCPVLASCAASIPEACGQGASYFDPKDPQKLCEKIKELPQIRTQLILSGKKQALQFSWKKSGAKHRKIFELLTI